MGQGLVPTPPALAGQAARESVQEKMDTNPDRRSAQAASQPGAGWGKDGIQIQTSLSRSVSGAWCKAGLPADPPTEGSRGKKRIPGEVGLGGGPGAVIPGWSSLAGHPRPCPGVMLTRPLPRCAC